MPNLNPCSDCRGTGKDPTAVALERQGAVLPLRCGRCNGTGRHTDRWTGPSADLRRILCDVFADATDVFGSPFEQYMNDAVFYNKVNRAMAEIERRWSAR